MLDKKIVKLLKPINKGVFIRPHDHNDFKLGQLVEKNIDAYEEAQVVIIGCPQDIGVKRNNGRHGASLAPEVIRTHLYKMAVSRRIQNLRILDLGDLKTEGDLEDIHLRLELVVSRLIKDNKRVIILGGGNDISYPDVKALSQIYNKEIVAINIDKHFDVRDLTPINSGTPYRYLLEEHFLLPKNFVELGIEEYANSLKYYDYLEQKGVQIFELEQIRSKGLENIFKQLFDQYYGEPFFFGFDIDSVKSCDAPGVSAPSSTGFTAEEIVTIGKMAGSYLFTRIIEITEFNPLFDIDNRTARLSALIIYYFLNELSNSLLQVEKQSIQAKIMQKKWDK